MFDKYATENEKEMKENLADPNVRSKWKFRSKRSRKIRHGI
jgi:hypothetical protein